MAVTEAVDYKAQNSNHPNSYCHKVNAKLGNGKSWSVMASLEQLTSNSTLKVDIFIPPICMEA
eukprot:4513113-Pleurochrysis_carterae.AAC.1